MKMYFPLFEYCQNLRYEYQMRLITGKYFINENFKYFFYFCHNSYQWKLHRSIKPFSPQSIP
jgi:hypothetical protein